MLTAKSAIGSVTSTVAEAVLLETLATLVTRAVVFVPSVFVVNVIDTGMVAAPYTGNDARVILRLEPD